MTKPWQGQHFVSCLKKNGGGFAWKFAGKQEYVNLQFSLAEIILAQGQIYLITCGPSEGTQFCF